MYVIYNNGQPRIGIHAILSVWSCITIVFLTNLFGD